MLYLDNAATSWPKPESVISAISEFNRKTGANPGRSGHRMSIEAGRIVFGARVKTAALFGIPDPLNVIFTKNATEAANVATMGLLAHGDRVIVTGMEHNAIMRPLRYLEKYGIEIHVVPVGEEGIVDPSEIKESITKNTKAIYANHVSNVTGTITDVRSIGEIAKDNGIIMCVDAAQSAGIVPIDVELMHIDLLVFTGHKGLFGPQGTGGLYIRENIASSIHPIVFGGTGSRSEYEEQPEFLPDKFEGGTMNACGLAGLAAGIDFINYTGMDEISNHEMKLTDILIHGLMELDAVRIYGKKGIAGRTGVVSFRIENTSVSDVSMALDEEYAIMTRPGLHCAPAAHRSIGTFPEGTVRASLGYFNTEEDVERTILAVRKIAKKAGA